MAGGAGSFRHYSLTVTTSPQNLDTVLSGARDAPLRTITLEANSANTSRVFVGGRNTTVASTSYAFSIPIPVSSVPAAPLILESSAGKALYLGQFAVIGAATNDILRIGVIPL